MIEAMLFGAIIYCGGVIGSMPCLVNAFSYMAVNGDFESDYSPVTVGIVAAAIWPIVWIATLAMCFERGKQ